LDFEICPSERNLAEEIALVYDKNKNCPAGIQRPPELFFVKTVPDLKLGNHAFPRLLPAYHAQIASTFWTRVMGDISNTRSYEVLAHIAVVIFDEHGVPIEKHQDFLAFETWSGSEFDIKISPFYDNARTYGLEVTKTDDCSCS
jgi:hypothetical protein